ncbi:MAG: radical SAM protein, partial [Nanoarchaeota archaeon]|nr:radical SAM protein [Nanoarchaeota archaeon]
NIMISNLIKIEQQGNQFILFNKRGMVLELNKKEYNLFQKYAHQKKFPWRHKEFFNKLCYYEMTDFEDYLPVKVPVEYSQKLLSHDSEKPLYKSPIIAHLGITSACNMQCEYCSIRQPYRKTKELSTKEWKQVIKKLSNFGVFQIGFTGGEPTLRKDLVELAEYVSSQKCTFNLTTNCWNINEDLIVDLKKAGMKQCQVSLDCHKAEVNDALRQKGSRDRVIRSIKLLQKHNIVVGIDCVVSKNNLKHILEFVKWLEKENVPALTLIKIKQGDLLLNKFKELLPDYVEYSNLINELCNRKNENPCVTIDCGSVSNLQSVLKKDELDKVPVAGCPVAHTLLSISPNGDIYPCVALSTSEFKIGNALQDNLYDLWEQNKVLCTLRLMKSKITGQCQSCDRLDRCRGGCRGIAKSLYSSLWESDKTCKYLEVKNGSQSR